VMLPMYQSEALWIHFDSPRGYPFAVKVATGKINAVTGEAWSDGLHRNPQDYAAVPGQPWLDGYCVQKGIIRQFVAMPLGSGYSAEEQITGRAEHGGVQIVVYPVRAEVWERMRRATVSSRFVVADAMPMLAESPGDYDMGLAPGGKMEQDIYDDELRLEDWETRQRGRCFVHLANSLVWQSITGAPPPSPPLTAEAYTRAGLPWFDYYDDRHQAVEGAAKLNALDSVTQMGKKKGEVPLPENTSVDPQNVIPLKPKRTPDEVREGRF
jgi:hypothetical protein